MNNELKDIRKLAGLNEGYEDRIERAAKYVLDTNPKTKEDVMREIKGAARYFSDAELQLGNKAWNDYVKDILTALKGKLALKRKVDPNRVSAKEKREHDSQVIAQIIVDAVGNSYPDGDPFDIIRPKVERMGYRDYDISDILDKAAKKLGSASYNQYLQDFWDDASENDPGRDNPWR